MKFPISWHQECLKNKTAHYARERQNAMEALARCDKGDAECAFYERQIAEAQRRKMTDFDLDRLMKSNAPAQRGRAVTPDLPTETTPRPSLKRLVSWHFYDGGFWLRIFGRAISIVNKRKHPPLFSERNGYRRVIYLGRWGIEWRVPANEKGEPQP